MSKDPYAILRALVRAESLRNAPKPTPTRDTHQVTPEPSPEQQSPPKDHERG
ncbi:hypothetical protein [Streptomyces phaeochromogenes]|uniref:hypothetical protein n=1 Tax=Streptomyces phaeochromogenes TaxID=1923 RepID=UPI002DD829D5|nr:hypothetical protein [Streptomyces phaeochromogenes]WRZ30712.1 hypothetical protein OG931_24700 [Streptomyces phaeochromogenes]